jgi:hypothetical protein
MLARLWAENKKFLLITGTGLTMFLLLNSWADAYIGRAEGWLDEATHIEREIRELKRELNRGYWREKSRSRSYGDHETRLLRAIENSPEPELGRFDRASPRLQFNQAIDRVWASALEQANRSGLRIPEKLAPEDFGLDRSDGRREYERYYDYLGVVRRALEGIVAAGIAEIGRPELIPEEDSLVAENERFACRFRAARFELLGSSRSFVELLDQFQRDGEFLQVRLVDLRGSQLEGQLRGTVEFAGMRLIHLDAEAEADMGNVEQTVDAGASESR